MTDVSRDTPIPTKLPVRPAMTQISLRIRAGAFAERSIAS